MLDRSGYSKQKRTKRTNSNALWYCCTITNVLGFIMSIAGIIALILYLSNHQNDVDRLDDKDTSLMNKDSVHDQRLDDLETNNTLQNVRLGGLEAKDMIIMQNITDLASLIDSIDGILDGNVTIKLTDLMMSVMELIAKDDILMVNISNLEAKDMVLMVNISSLDSRVVQNENDIIELQNNIDVLLINISSIDNRVTQNELGITNIENDIVDLQAKDMVLMSNVTMLKDLIDGIGGLVGDNVTMKLTDLMMSVMNLEDNAITSILAGSGISVAPTPTPNQITIGNTCVLSVDSTTCPSPTPFTGNVNIIAGDNLDSTCAPTGITLSVNVPTLTTALAPTFTPIPDTDTNTINTVVAGSEITVTPSPTPTGTEYSVAVNVPTLTTTLAPTFTPIPDTNTVTTVVAGEGIAITPTPTPTGVEYNISAIGGGGASNAVESVLTTTGGPVIPTSNEIRITGSNTASQQGAFTSGSGNIVRINLDYDTATTGIVDQITSGSRLTSMTAAICPTCASTSTSTPTMAPTPSITGIIAAGIGGTATGPTITLGTATGGTTRSSSPNVASGIQVQSMARSGNTINVVSQRAVTHASSSNPSTNLYDSDSDVGAYPFCNPICVPQIIGCANTFNNVNQQIILTGGSGMIPAGVTHATVVAEMFNNAGSSALEDGEVFHMEFGLQTTSPGTCTRLGLCWKEYIMLGSNLGDGNLSREEEKATVHLHCEIGSTVPWTPYIWWKIITERGTHEGEPDLFFRHVSSTFTTHSGSWTTTAV